MSDPTNYYSGLTPANPVQALTQGFGLTQGIRQAFDARAAAEEQARRQAALEALRQKVVSGQATGEERANFLTQLAPEQTKAYQEALNGMDQARKTQGLTDLGKVYSAFAGGNRDIAIGLLEERARGKREAGDEEGAKILETAINMEKTQPGQGQFFIANNLALFGKEGQDLIDSVNKNLGAPGERALTEAKTAEAWANALRQKASGGLSTDAEKIINLAVDNVTGATLLASQATNLADAIDKLRPVGGWAGATFEGLKKAIGGQDAVSALKQEYTRLRNQDVIKNLPPGVASDKDIQIALEAFPPDNAAAENISLFLRGMARLQAYRAETEKARAEWVTNNGNLGSAREEFSISGKPVKKGQSFWDFTANISIPNITPQAVAKGGR